MSDKRDLDLYLNQWLADGRQREILILIWTSYLMVLDKERSWPWFERMTWWFQTKRDLDLHLNQWLADVRQREILILIWTNNLLEVLISIWFNDLLISDKERFWYQKWTKVQGADLCWHFQLAFLLVKIVRKLNLFIQLIAWKLELIGWTLRSCVWIGHLLITFASSLDPDQIHTV